MYCSTILQYEGTVMKSDILLTVEWCNFLMILSEIIENVL